MVSKLSILNEAASYDLWSPPGQKMVRSINIQDFEQEENSRSLDLCKEL